MKGNLDTMPAYQLLRAFVRYTRSMIFYAVNYIKLQCVLKQTGASAIRQFKFSNWHDGYAYYTGYKAGVKVFIKIDLGLQFLSNDYLAYRLLKEEVKTIAIEEFYAEDEFQVAIFPYVQGRNLTEQDIIDAPSLLEEVRYVLERFYELGLIHRDVRLENFMLVESQLYIIDFTFITSLPHSANNYNFKKLNINDSRQKKVLRKLGGRLNPEQYVWNDFYSVTQIISKALEGNKLNKETRNSLENSMKVFEVMSKLPQATYSLKEEK